MLSLPSEQWRAREHTDAWHEPWHIVPRSTQSLLFLLYPMLYRLFTLHSSVSCAMCAVRHRPIWYFCYHHVPSNKHEQKRQQYMQQALSYLTSNRRHGWYLGSDCDWREKRRHCCLWISKSSLSVILNSKKAFLNTVKNTFPSKSNWNRCIYITSESFFSQGTAATNFNVPNQYLLEGHGFYLPHCYQLYKIMWMFCDNSTCKTFFFFEPVHSSDRNSRHCNGSGSIYNLAHDDAKQKTWPSLNRGAVIQVVALLSCDFRPQLFCLCGMR